MTEDHTLTDFQIQTQQTCALLNLNLLTLISQNLQASFYFQQLAKVV